MWLAAPTGFIPNRAGPKILLIVPTASTLTRARARTQLTDPITPIVTLLTTHTLALYQLGTVPGHRSQLPLTLHQPGAGLVGRSPKDAFSELTLHPRLFPFMQPLRAKPLSSVLTRLSQSKG